MRSLRRLQEWVQRRGANSGRQENASTTLAPIQREVDGELTRREAKENAWAAAGWVEVWSPTAAVPGGHHADLWARRGELLRLFPGRRPPSPTTAAHFYVNDGKVYRDEGHPEGPSSVPYFVIRRRYVYAAEGHPTGAGERIHYEITTIRQRGQGTRVKANPSFGELPDPD